MRRERGTERKSRLLDDETDSVLASTIPRCVEFIMLSDINIATSQTTTWL
jgi:hypothetical protein